MTTVTTHVLDTASGMPVPKLAVTLLESEPEPEGPWGVLTHARTDEDGRIGSFPDVPAGRYRLVFDTRTPFFPEVVVTFEVERGREHVHVPLLLSPYGYSVYRGS